MAIKNKRKVKALLAENGMSQVDLAKLMNLSIVTMNVKINDLTKFKMGELYNLAEVFEMSLIELIQYLEQ